MSIYESTQKEYDNHGTSWTRNDFFDKNGYFIIKNLCDPKILFHPLPELRGQVRYHGRDLNDFDHKENYPIYCKNTPRLSSNVPSIWSL